MTIFLVVLALSFIPAFVYASVLYWLDRYEKEPKRLLLGAFLWGALVATVGAIILSIIFEAGLLAITGSAALADLGGVTVGAPLIEESLKGLAVLLIFLVFPREFDSVLDGIVYGGITALGFAATENVLYLLGAYNEGGLVDMIVLFILRVILGGWGHAVYTACIGIGLAAARLSRSPLVKLMAPVAGWLAAVSLHGLHNTMATLLSEQMGLEGLGLTLLVDWTSWACVFGIIVWAIMRERRWISVYLHEEMTAGIIRPDQYQTATSLRAQLRARMGAGSRARARATRRFYELCAELAQKKHQRATLGEERGNSALIARLRAEIAQLAPQI